MPMKRESGEGCTCPSPCPWKQEWTKSHQKADLAAFLKLRGVKPAPDHISQIDKDVHRTYSSSPTFNRHGIFR
jgi:hypothetical protein